MKEQPDTRLVAAAVAAANQSRCAKSQRGVAILVAGATSATRIVAAFNGPPDPMVCPGTEACRTHCRRLAVHAEARALLKCGGHLAVGAELLHIKTSGGLTVPSGGPSCPSCSKLILDAGVRRVWLLHDDGWRAYPSLDFHQMSLAACALPIYPELGA